jgi:L-fuculose-phosphate aldolase
MATERQYREQIVRYGRALHERAFVAATDGNLSVRLDKNRILATPTCMSKGEMRPADLAIGKVVFWLDGAGYRAKLQCIC